MDVVILFFFFLASAVFTFFGYYATRNGHSTGAYLAGIGALGFILVGLLLLNNGADVYTIHNTVNNFTATDSYHYSFNITFNTSQLDNVTTVYNRTGWDYYSYNNASDDTTKIIAFLIFFGGALIGNDVFTSYRRNKNKEGEAG